MKRAITSRFSKKLWKYFIVLLMVGGLQSGADLYGQCQGFNVSVDAPPWYSFCAGEMIDLVSTVSGGTGPYTYSWSTGGTGPIETIPGPAVSMNIFLTVTDANGCVATASAHIKPQNMNIFISVSGGPACEIVEFITLQATGGPTYTYLWSTGETTQSIDVNTAGTYSVTATDSDTGCTAEASVTPTFFPLPTPEIIGDILVCTGVPTTLSVTGGPYATYQWGPNGGSSPELITDVAGNYTVTITDDNGCPGEDDFDVLPFTEIPPTLSAPPFLCPESNGTVEVVNASDYVSFSWSNGQQSPSTIAFPAENYEVTVTDANGCTETQFAYVGMYDVLFPGIVGDYEICEGQDTTTLTVYPPFSNYNWSTNETTQAIDVSEPELYSITVTDGNGCTTTGEHMVQPAPFPEPVIPAPPASCTGNPVQLTVSGGPYPTYEWSTGETNDTITVDSSGNYEVMVSNVFGCTASTNLELTMSTGPTATVSSSPYNCDGTMTLTATGGDSYEWSNGDSTATTIVQNNGTYSVIVTDSAGCTATAVDTVTIPTIPQVSISGPMALCVGASGNLIASSGFTQYLWPGGETTAEISVSQPGNFNVTVTDANGCTATASQSIAQSPSPEPAVTGPVGFCENGSATLQLNQSFSQIIWSNGDETQSITVSEPITYTVTVTDVAGCTGTDQVAVTEYAPPTVAITGPTSICSGGTANFSVSNNFSQINWSTGETTQSINVNTAGNYQVTVTDANGCTNTDVQELEIGASLTPVIATTATSCDGEMTLDAGIGFDTYLWSNGETVQNITVNANGSYSVTVSDGTGCTGEDSEAVTMPVPPTINIAGPTAVCEGESANLTAGAGFTSYEWSNGETTATISVSQPNTYSIVATDANGCTAEASLVFENNPLPTASISGPSSICIGSTASLEVTGSFSQINWNTGETSPVIDVTQSGAYSVVVTDANGCTNEAAHEVEIGSSLTPAIVTSGNVCDGMATLDAGGGYINYLWSNGLTTPSITVTTTGSYSVTVSDATGCSGEISEMVTIPTPPQVSITGPDSACEGVVATFTADAGFASYQWTNGATTSSIDVSQTGIYEVIVTDANGCTASSNKPFEYVQAPAATIIGPSSICTGSQAQLSVSGNFAQVTWSNGANTNDITVSQAGTYSVVVSDGNGCSVEATHNLEIGTSLSPVITTTDVSCDGWAILDAGGGFSNYSWSNGEVGQSIIVNGEGLYAVTVSDGTGCSGETTLMLTLPTPPVVDILGSPTMCTGSSTEFSVPNNFTQVVWSTGELTNSITVFNEGIYTVTVTDANGCTATDEINLEVANALSPDITNTLADCDGTSTLSAGGGFDSYLWSNGSTNPTITVTSNGTYAVTVSDASGCTGIATIDITLPVPPIVSIAGAQGLCVGDETMLVAPGGFDQYLWNTGQTTPSITVSLGGIYSVTVSDENGCTATDEWLLEQWQTDYSFIEEEACSTLDTGTVETIFTNQFGCDSLVITSIVLAPELTTTISLSACEGSSAEYNGVAIAAGASQEFVYNAFNGCDSVVTVSVTAMPSVDFELSATETCWNAHTGSIQVAMLNGTAPYQYALNGGGIQTTSVFTDLPAGQHLISVSDANGCVLSETIDILQTEPVDILIEEPELTCDESAVLLQPTVVSGDMTNIQWLWPDGITDPYMMVEQAGNYLLQVDDGCEMQEIPIHVSWADERRDGDFFFIPNTFSPNYDGVNDLFKVYPGHDFVIKSFEFKIFDRWGDMMFGTTNTEEGWDGMYRHVQKQPGVYVWFVKAKLELCGGREMDYFKEGGVTIMR